MGPIQIMMFGFEDFHATGAVAEELGALSEAGTIRVIDARFLLKEDDGNLVAVRASDLTEDERDDLRAAAGALMGMGAGAVLGGAEGALDGALLGAEAGLWIGDAGMTPEELDALGAELMPGDALLLLVIENVWAEGLRDALRDAGAIMAGQDYLTPEGLVALGALLGVEAIAEG